jgi:hypothetical protein
MSTKIFKKEINYKIKINDLLPQVKQLNPDQPLPNLVCGLDLGASNTVCGCVIDTRGVNHQNLRRNILIKKSSLNYPTHLFQDDLEEHKLLYKETTNNEIYIHKVENTSTYKGPEETNEVYYNRIIKRYEDLSKFYNSRNMKKKRWDLRKAKVG